MDIIESSRMARCQSDTDYETSSSAVTACSYAINHLEHDHSSDESADSGGGLSSSSSSDMSTPLSRVYQELADKEQALLMAAQFGKTLIDEKEELERQYETMKREQQTQIEQLEQESYELKRLVESMRNEYESKLYELNDDLALVRRELKQREMHSENSMSSQLLSHREQQDAMHELGDQNEQLNVRLRLLDAQLTATQLSVHDLEAKLTDKEQQLAVNGKLLTGYQKEMSKYVSKQQELEYALLQSYMERDRHSKLIDELSKKYMLLEGEKSELEHMMIQQENEIFRLTKLNESITLKFELATSGGLSGGKRRSLSTLGASSQNKLKFHKSALGASPQQLATSTVANDARAPKFDKSGSQEYNNETATSSVSVTPSTVNTAIAVATTTTTFDPDEEPLTLVATARESNLRECASTSSDGTVCGVSSICNDVFETTARLAATQSPEEEGRLVVADANSASSDPTITTADNPVDKQNFFPKNFADLSNSSMHNCSAADSTCDHSRADNNDHGDDDDDFDEDDRIEIKSLNLDVFKTHDENEIEQDEDDDLHQNHHHHHHHYRSDNDDDDDAADEADNDDEDEVAMNGFNRASVDYYDDFHSATNSNEGLNWLQEANEHQLINDDDDNGDSNDANNASDSNDDQRDTNINYNSQSVDCNCTSNEEDSRNEYDANSCGISPVLVVRMQLGTVELMHDDGDQSGDGAAVEMSTAHLTPISAVSSASFVSSSSSFSSSLHAAEQRAGSVPSCSSNQRSRCRSSSNSSRTPLTPNSNQT